jgi:hypothetical protein
MRLCNQWSRPCSFFQAQLEGYSYGSVQSQYVGQLPDFKAQLKTITIFVAGPFLWLRSRYRCCL